MDDPRIERALRRGPPGDPRFDPSGRWLHEADRAVEVAAESRPTAGLRLFAAVAAIAAVFLLAAVIAGPLLQVREHGVGGLVAEIERRGNIRVALDGGPPQAFAPSGGYDGFDIDVARELASRLGVRLDLVVVPRAEILRGESGGDWEVAISSVPDALSLGPTAQTTEPYAIVTGGLAVRADDTASTLDDLADETLCVVSGSVAEAWASGSLQEGELASPPVGADVMTRESVEECVAVVTQGMGRAVVVDRRSDIASSAGLRSLLREPFEARLVAVVDGRADGAATLVSRLNRLFTEMAADGTIREYGQRRFAGDDVTPPSD
jgi:ABC-type amino acid transport substrate-binding protein